MGDMHSAIGREVCFRRCSAEGQPRHASRNKAEVWNWAVVLNVICV